MNVLFLDIDGVLNDHTPWPNGYCGIQPDKVALLNEILTQTARSKIVLSSAWRYMISGGAMTLRGFEYMLQACGFGFCNTLLDITTSDEVYKGRGRQIEKWLQGNTTGPDALNVENYVILDDDAYDINFEPVQSRLVLCDGKKGLTSVEVDRVVALFQN